MAISMRLSNADEQLIRSYTELHGISISDFARTSMIEKIEDEIDLKLWHEAKAEFDKDKTTHTHDELKEMLGFTKK